MATNNSINLNAPGIASYDGAGTFFGRTIQGTGNVVVTNGDGISGNPSISVSGIMSWVEVTGTSQAMSAGVGYVANNASLVTLTLPATAALGDSIRIVGKGAGLWKIAQNATQQIVFGKLPATVGTGGSLTALQATDCVALRCTTSGTATVWTVEASQGNITVV